MDHAKINQEIHNFQVAENLSKWWREMKHIHSELIEKTLSVRGNVFRTNMHLEWPFSGVGDETEYNFYRRAGNGEWKLVKKRSEKQLYSGTGKYDYGAVCFYEGVVEQLREMNGLLSA